MKFPVQAFAELHPKDLEPGRLFKIHGQWALRVLHADEFEGFLMFEGDRAGKVFKIGDGMARSIAIVHPFNWFPVVAGDATPSRDAATTITLAMTSDGPVLTGSDARDHFADTDLSFGLDGHGIDGSNLHRASRYEQWSAELFHDALPFVSLGTLFEVDRRRQQC